MFMSMAVGMAVQTRYGVLATVALYLIIYVEVFFSIKTNLLILKAQRRPLLQPHARRAAALCTQG